MSLNFNVGPYFDDFDPSKNFHRILFKPGSAVQARELTQSQTILQNQISNFASSIFTQNTPVNGGQVTINQNCYYIKLNDTDPNGAIVTASNFLGQVIQDTTGTILARVTATAEASGDPATLIVSYLSGPRFTDGSIIRTSTSQTTYSATVAQSTQQTLNGVTTTISSTGLSSTASIATGIFYIVNGYSVSQTNGTQYSIGNFVQVNPQTIVLDKYDNIPSYRVGLQITETINDYVDDVSLLDPAIGASNYQAPGADRYVILLTLVTLPLTLGNDDGFIELVRIENGNIVKQVDGTVYSTIDDYFAKRDYETNGDYVVDDFKLTPSANTVNSGQYDISVSKGIAYVHGYRVENQSQIVLTNDRARNTANIAVNSVPTEYGNYFAVDTANGVFDISTMPQIDFHCVSAANINVAFATGYSSTLIGNGFIRGMTYLSGTGTITKNYIYNAYVSDITSNTLTGNVASTGNTSTTFAINDLTGAFSSVNSAYYNVLVNVTTSGVTDTRNITSYVGSTKLVTVDSPLTITPSSSLNTTFTLVFQQKDVESIVKTVGSGSYALSANVNINTATGKVNGISTGDTILTDIATPELLWTVGYPYVAQIANSNYYSQRVYRGKSFTGSTLTLSATSNDSSNPLQFTGSGTLSGVAAQQQFIVIDNTGAILDFNTSGNTVSIAAGGASATFTSAAYSGKTGITIIASVFVSSADSASYTLKSKHLITGNNTIISGSLAQVSSTGVYQDLTKGQILITKASLVSPSKNTLYINDVKNIVKIIDTNSTSVAPSGSFSSYTDITNYFTLDNGQRDSFYDHASVSLVPGAPQPVGNILIVVNYYGHTQDSSGDGYFSVQSYSNTTSVFGGVTTAAEAYAQIPKYTADNGITYSLSDAIDFRPCRKNSQTSYVWEYSKTTAENPDIGMLLPRNLTGFISYYQYYLGRKDKLVLTKDKSFQIIQGVPSVTPSLPAEPSGSLLIANLTHDPYTSYVPGEAAPGVVSNLSVNKVIHKRWAKSDITDLESRVNNLEYYTSLSILEQNAQSLQIPDSNGLNRFKNGILVDDFSSYSTADTSNADYFANINIRNNQLSPVQVVNNYQLQNPVVLNSLGTLSNTNTYLINSISGTQTNIFTLPYKTAPVVVQPLASSVVSVNPFSVIMQQGIAQLNPPMDNWVDNFQAPAILISDPSMQVYQATNGVNLTNSGDWNTIPGTSSTVTTSSNQFRVTATTTQTYASQLQNSTSSAYNPVSSTFGTNNGYLTNIAILPYIRPQQIIVRAVGLLVNTPIYTFFDGVNVAKYLTSPNTIELTGVSGTFKADDIVGFYVANNFYPAARVISVYNYPNGTQSRLYVAKIVTAPGTIGTKTLQNAFFNVNGTYTSTTASGTISNTATANSIISLSQSGHVFGVGGGYANVLSGSTITQFYASPVVSGPTLYSAFLNNYGVWGDAVNGSTYNATIPVVFTTAGVYTVRVACSGTATVSANGASFVSAPINDPTTWTETTRTFPAATVNIGWSASNQPAGTSTAAFALVIVDSLNNVVFSSTTPVVPYTNAGTQVIMPSGGAWFVGATQLALDPTTASNVTDYYVGSKINIQSKYVYITQVGASYVPPPVVPSPGPGGEFHDWDQWFNWDQGGAGGTVGA